MTRRSHLTVAWLFLLALAARGADCLPLSVSGTAVQPDGAPLAGVRVLLLPVQSNYEWGRMILGGQASPEPIASAKTDSTGVFHLAVPTAGLWTVVAEAPDRVPVQLSPLAVVEPVELPPAILTESIGLRLRVISPEGKAAPGIWIYASSDAPQIWKRTAASGWTVRPRLGVTAADGILTLPRIPRERLTVQAVIDGVAAARRAGFDGGDLALPPAGGSIATLEIRDAEGRPASGVQVRIGEVQGPAAASGEDGRAVLHLPAGPRPKIRLLAADGRRWVGSLPAALKTQGGSSRVTLPRLSSLEGRVIDAVTRRPIEGALVWLPPDPGAFARTGAQGAYRLAALAGDPAQIQAEAASYLPLTHRLKLSRNGSSRGPSLALDRAATVAGAVVDAAGKPLAGARVRAIQRTALRSRQFTRSGSPERRAASGPDGRFRLDKLAAGETWDMVATRQGYAPARQALAQLSPGKSRADLRFVLGRGRTAAGRVVDREEKPVANAEVSLLATSGDRALEGDRPRKSTEEGVDAWTVATGPDGRFQIAALPAGRVDLRAAKAGFAAVSVRALPIPGGEGPFDLGTVILEPGAALSGIVVDRSGRPVPGAEIHAAHDLQRVRLAAENGVPVDRRPEAVTGADGRFALADLRRGDRFDLWVRAEGFASASAEGIPVPPREPVRLILDRGARVAGRVVDPDGLPVPDANLRLLADRPGEERGLIRYVGGAQRTAQADEDGRFVFASVPPGRVDVTAETDGLLPAKLEDLAVPAGGIEDLLITLERGAVIEGRVATAGGEAVEDARIVSGSAAAVSDADGAYRLEGVPVGHVSVRLLHPDYPPQDKSLEAKAEGNLLDFVLPDGRDVEGRVVDRDGKPVAEAALALFPAGSPRERQAMSGADGGFLFPRVADGTYTLRAEKAGYVTAEIEKAATVAGSPVRDLEVRLLQGSRIAGHITGLDLYDLAEVSVHASLDGTGSRPGRVGYEGSYEIAGLASGDWLVQAELRGGAREAHARATLEPGAEEARVDLEFGRSLTVTGHVLYGGEPLAGADLTLRGLDVSAARRVTTDSEGSFRVADVEPGSYRLQVMSHKESLNHSEDLQLDDDRDLLVQIAAARVSGTVVDATDQKPLPGAMIALRRLAGGEAAFLVAIGTDAEGYFALPAVTEGHYRMTVSRDGYSPSEREIDVSASASLQEMKIPLDRTAGLALEPRLDAGGRPASVTAAVLDSSGHQVLFETRPVDAAGLAHFPTVPPGSLELLMTAPGGAPATVQVTVPGEPVPVSFASGGRLTVRIPALAASDELAVLSVIAANGTPFRTLAPTGTIQVQWTLDGGKAVVEGLPAGAWRLSAVAPDGRSWSATVATTATDQEVQIN